MSILDLRKVIDKKIKEFGFFDEIIMWEEFIERESFNSLSEKSLMINFLETHYNDGKRYETAFTLNPMIKGDKGYNTCYYIQDKLIAFFNGRSGENENIKVENLIFEGTDRVVRDKTLQAWTTSIKIRAIYRDKLDSEKIEYLKMKDISINLKQKE